MSDNNNSPDFGNEADDSQSADSNLLFSRILERLDRLEKKLDSALAGNNRPSRPWSGGGDNRRPGGFSRPGGSFSRPGGSSFGAGRPFNKPSGSGFGGPPRSGGPGRFDGPRGNRPHQGGHGKPFGNRSQGPR